MLDPYKGEFITRIQARERGLTRYFTGKPCPKGHVAQRAVASAQCVVCRAEYQKEWNKRPGAGELRKQYSSKYRNSEKGKERQYLYHRSEQYKYRDAKRRDTASWKEKRQSYESREDVRERLRASEKERYKSSSLFREKRLTYAEQYRARPEYKENRQTYLKLYQETENGKGKRKAAHARRRARKSESGGTFSADDLARMQKTQKHCHICGKRFRKNDVKTVDHIIPLAKGGTHDVTNIMLAHLSCNCSKQDKILQLL